MVQSVRRTFLFTVRSSRGRYFFWFPHPFLVREGIVITTHILSQLLFPSYLIPPLYRIGSPSNLHYKVDFLIPHPNSFHPNPFFFLQNCVDTLNVVKSYRPMSDPILCLRPHYIVLYIRHWSRVSLNTQFKSTYFPLSL